MGYLVQALLQHAIRRGPVAGRLARIAAANATAPPLAATARAVHTGSSEQPPSPPPPPQSSVSPLVVKAQVWRPVEPCSTGESPPPHVAGSMIAYTAAAARTVSSGAGLNNDGDNDGYMPLLFRTDFMRSWHRPHAPLPLEALARPPRQPSQLQSATLSSSPQQHQQQQQQKSKAPLLDVPFIHQKDDSSSQTGDADGLLGIDDEEELVLEDLSDRTVTAAAYGGAVDAGEDTPMTYTSVSLPTTSRLILDPVQWLSQSPDAPLMDSTTLLRQIGPAVPALHYQDRASRTLHEAKHDSNRGDCENGEADEQGTSVAEDVKKARRASAGSMQTATVAPAATEASTISREGERIAEERADSSARAEPHAHSSNQVRLRIPQHSPEEDASDSDRLVYNPITCRVTKEGAPAIQAFAFMGIHVDPATRELTLSDPDTFRDFVQKHRTRQIAWPSQWPETGPYKRFAEIVCDARLADPAEEVKMFLAVRYRRLRDRHKAGTVSAAGTSIDGDVEDGAEANFGEPTQDDRIFVLSDLNEEQRKVVALVKQGYHTYIGGFAGTGKTVLLNVMKQELRRMGLAVAVTATTGVASTLIGGLTLHNEFGINRRGEFARRSRLEQFDVIIIDEVSMLPREVFELLDWELRKVNGSALPFGGVQIILCGDFLQLSAVAAESVVNAPLFRHNFVMLKLTVPVRQAASPLFLKQLSTLRRGVIPVGLDQTVNFIAHTDPMAAAEAQKLQTKQREMLTTILGEAEMGRHTSSGVMCTGETAAAADAASTVTVSEGGVQGDASSITGSLGAVNAPTVNIIEGALNLLPTNEEVDAVNAHQLAKRPGDLAIFPAQVLPPDVEGVWSPTYLLRINPARPPEVKKLSECVGDFVGEYMKTTGLGEAWQRRGMTHTHVVLYALFADALALRVRVPMGLQRSEVEGFERYMSEELDAHLAKRNPRARVRDILPSAEGLQTERDDYILDYKVQFNRLAKPLKVKLGARVMLRANLTKDLVNGSIGTVVGFRELRADTLPRHFYVRPSLVEAATLYADYVTTEHGFPAAVVPVVDFGGGRCEPIPPCIVSIGGTANTHYYTRKIVAIPLSLAYAFTVHKVQGLTLVGRVHLELSRMWPCEHLLYVAMSRVRNPEQLSVSNFRRDLVRAAADCLAFDDALPSVDYARVLPHFVQATWLRAPTRRKVLRYRQAMERKAKKEKMAKRKLLTAKRMALEAKIHQLQEEMLSQQAPAS